MSTSDIAPRTIARPSKLVSNSLLDKLSLGTSSSALLAKLSCCVLPLVLVGLGTGSAASSSLRWLVPFQTPLLVVGGIATAAAWGMYLYSRKASCESDCASTRTSRSSLAVLMVSTLMFGLAASWALFQPTLMKLLGGV